MVFCSMNWAITIVVFCTSGVDGLFYYMGLIISGYFKVLQKRMEALDEINAKNIEDLICKHNEIIKSAKFLPKCYTVVFFGQFLYSASMMSFLGFQLATVSRYTLYFIDGQQL